MEILPPRVPQYVHSYAYTPVTGTDQPSPGRSATACAAMCLDFAHPGKYDLYRVEAELYTRLGADPTKSGIINFFSQAGVALVDLDELVTRALQGDTEPLHQEMEAQARQGVIHFLTVANEARLVEATTGVQIHNWPSACAPSSLIRLGFSDTDGYGLYWEPDAPQFNQGASATSYSPVKITWASILDAQIITCLAIMPPDVPAPPAGFSFQAGQWPPAPAPQVDAGKAAQLLQAIISECQARDQAMANYVASNKAILDAATAFNAEIQAVTKKAS